MIARLSLLLALLSISACGGDSLGFGEPCATGDQCADGVCFAPYDGSDGTCTSACAGDRECPNGTTCGTLADGGRACLTACTVDGDTVEGFGCVAGAQVSCARAGDAAPCWQCGCVSGEYCPFSNSGEAKCEPLRAERESCFSNQECTSGNCSIHDRLATQPGTCLMPHGATCNAGELGCLSCDPTVDGYVCARGCQGADRCDLGEECIGRAETGYFCRPDCDSIRCPMHWTCEVASSTLEVTYCAPPRRCDPTATYPCGLFGTCHPELRFCY